MKISEIFKQKKRVFSFEVFPPKKQELLPNLHTTLERLSRLAPDFISVTNGAGGNAPGVSTCRIAASIKSENRIEAIAHITCVNSTKEEIIRSLRELEENKIENILALRGDISPDMVKKGELAHSGDLVRFIKENGEFHLSGACYPQGHAESKSREEELIHLKEKVEAGARHLISQLFLENHFFYDYIELLEKTGIHVPVSAGIMPVTNKAQIERIASLCGIKIPGKVRQNLERYGDSPESLMEAGIEYAIGQICDLYANGVVGIHLYTMNNPDVARRICEGIGRQ